MIGIYIQSNFTKPISVTIAAVEDPRMRRERDRLAGPAIVYTDVQRAKKVSRNARWYAA